MRENKGRAICLRPWCLRGDVNHRSGFECAPLELLIELADMYFGVK